MNIENQFMVAGQRDKIVLLILPPSVMTREEALNLAAWLVALADDKDEFARLLEEVRNS